jgi:peptidyl-dipeptidase Dcp
MTARRTALIAAFVVLVPGSHSIETQDVNAQDMEKPNPLLAPWTGPYGGVPPFDQVQVADFAPALEAGMAAQLKEIDAIAGSGDLREHDCGARAGGPHAGSRADDL